MELMTVVMFLAGLAAGGAGVFFFKKKDTVVHPPAYPTPVTSHSPELANSKSLQDEIAKLQKEAADTASKNSRERQDFEAQISSLKSVEAQLKEQLIQLSNDKSSGQSTTGDVERLKLVISENQTEIAQLNKDREDAQRYFDNIQKQLEERSETIKSLEIKLLEASSTQSSAVSNVSVKPITERKILVVDDSKVVRNKLSSTLKKAGYQVQLAEDGVDALNKLKEDNSFDLIVTDLEMPNLDGHGLITAVHSNADFKEIPVMAITGHEDITLNVVHSEGLVGVHKKPWKDDELLMKLEGLSNLK